MNKSSSKNFQPEPQPNSEQKADGLHFSPAIGNTNVACWRSGRKVLLFWLIELIIVVGMCCLLPKNQNWYVGLFANGIGLFFGFIINRYYERSLKNV